MGLLTGCQTGDVFKTRNGLVVTVTSITPSSDSIGRPYTLTYIRDGGTHYLWRYEDGRCALGGPINDWDPVVLVSRVQSKYPTNRGKYVRSQQR